MKEPTTLDYIILGLIQQNPLTGYRIGKTFEDTALGNFGGSPGTIYPALKRLEKNAFISKDKSKEGGRSVFSITEVGKEQLRSWLLTPPAWEQVKKNVNLLVLKFAFMDPMISTDQKIGYLDMLQMELENYLKELQQYHSEEGIQLPINGRLAFEHGLMIYKTSLDWCLRAKISLRDQI